MIAIGKGVVSWPTLFITRYIQIEPARVLEEKKEEKEERREEKRKEKRSYEKIVYLNTCNDKGHY